MNVEYSYQGILFEWDSEKAAANVAKHGISFEAACEAFFDPFVRIMDEELAGYETRDTVIGMTLRWRFSVSSTPSASVIASGSSQHGKPPRQKGRNMKTNELNRRLRKDRPMVAISMRIPEDVIDDLKRVAPQLGFSGYQPLIRAYIGQGLREDLAKLESTSSLEDFVENLRQRGVDEDVIREALTDSN